MRVITVNLPECTIDLLDQMVAAGLITSRSEGIRQLTMRGFENWIEQFAIMREAQHLLLIQKENKKGDVVRVPKFSEYFDSANEIKSYKVVRRLE